jgi:hypothetical protein
LVKKRRNSENREVLNKKDALGKYAKNDGELFMK